MSIVIIAMCLIVLTAFYALWVVSYLPQKHLPGRTPPKGGASSGRSSAETLQSWWDEFFNQNEYQNCEAVGGSRRGPVC